MSTIDIIILGMLAVGAFSGYRQGLFIGILSILAFFVGIILAFRFMNWGAELLTDKVESLTFMLPFVAFVLIFLAVTISIRILAFEFQVPSEMKKDAVIYPVIVPVAPTMVAVLDDYTPIIDTAIATIKELVNSSSSDIVN